MLTRARKVLISSAARPGEQAELCSTRARQKFLFIALLARSEPLKQAYNPSTVIISTALQAQLSDPVSRPSVLLNRVSRLLTPARKRYSSVAGKRLAVMNS